MQNIYTDMWFRLNQVQVTPIPDSSDSQFNFRSALTFFSQETRLKIINLRTLTPAERTYVESKHIILANVIKNLQTSAGQRLRDRWAFQLNAVRKTAVYAFCPFSGRLVASSRSMVANLNSIFYRFSTEEVFYVIIAGIGSGFEKQALYFPQHEVVITIGDSWGFQAEDLAELKARMVCNAVLSYKYLSARGYERQRIALCIGFYHFAHHLWNELSGVFRLYQLKLLAEVDTILVMREPLGRLEQIFPEIPADTIHRITDTAHLFDEVLRNDYFAIRLGNDFVARALTARVYKVAQRNCLPATLDRVHKAQKVYFPLLWIGIRVQSRTWCGQADGLANIICLLRDKFPRLGVVFDGFSLPADRIVVSNDSQEYDEIIDQERAVVNEVSEKVRDRGCEIGLFDIVGGSIFDANIWAHAIDVYVSPYGSIQHKVGWLGSKPGVIHSNLTLLGGPSPFIWSAVQDAKVPRYVNPSTVSDVEPNGTVLYKQLSDYAEVGAGIRAADRKASAKPEFNNYTVEWRPVFEDLLDLLESRKRVFVISRREVTRRFKRAVKETIRGLTFKAGGPGV